MSTAMEVLCIHTTVSGAGTPSYVQEITSSPIPTGTSISCRLSGITSGASRGRGRGRGERGRESEGENKMHDTMANGAYQISVL